MTGIDNLQSSKFIKMGKELQEVTFLMLSSQGLPVRLKETPLDIEQSMNGIHYQTVWSVLKI